MILIVGAASSGKTTYARKLANLYGWGEDELALDVEELLWDERRALPLTPDLPDALAHKQVVTCAEVGGGVVPLSREERAWREAVGQLACALAGQATEVVRMVCGIPVPLKGELSTVYAAPEAAHESPSSSRESSHE